MQATTKADEPSGGRIFFSGAERSLVEEDTISLVSAGVDIGSATTHLVLSKIELERLDTRYVVSSREVIYRSDVFLTPYVSGEDIDTVALQNFFQSAYDQSGLSRDEIDTGALILTGVAVRRRNARAIGEMFAEESGKFVAVTAGDRLETILAAHGSGTMVASEEGLATLNIDIGGGTTKIALCQNGKVTDICVVEAGARLVVTDDQDRIERLEAFGKHYGDLLGLDLKPGVQLGPDEKKALADTMIANILAAPRGQCPGAFLRIGEAEKAFPKHMQIVLSGGVSEFFYQRERSDFGDLGPFLSEALVAACDAAGEIVLPGSEGIRATVLGASQQTVQLSGSTVFIDPLEALPLRNIVNIRPDLDLSGETLEVEAIADAVRRQRELLDLSGSDRALALSIGWQGSATYARLDALSRGLISGVSDVLAEGHPLVLMSDGDIGGLLGMHVRENELCPNPVVSVDGLDLSDFDFVDIGEVLFATGAVPVVVKSLVFPGEVALSQGGGDNE